MSDGKFLSDWRGRLDSGESGLRLVSMEHPLEIFVGANDVGAAKVTIQTKEKPKEPRLSHLVLVDRRQGQGGFWTLSLTLQDSKFREVFVRLVDDLHTRSSGAKSEADGLRIVDGVFDEWRRLLQARPQGVLSKEELRGLVGELWLLLNTFSTDRPMSEAVAGWLGPLSAHQDFFFESSGLHEAKSIGSTMTAVKISSEFQLDALGEELELVVLRVADVAEGATASISLVSLVTEVMARLDEESVGHEDLEVRLSNLGVDLQERYYADSWFVVLSVSTYSVTEDFPAVRRSTAPAGVERVKYQLDLSAIESRKTSFRRLQ